MITKTILDTVYNKLTSGVQDNMLNLAQQFNDADGRGIHGIIIRKEYEPYSKFVEGGRGFKGEIAPKLEALIYSTVHFGNQEGTSWEKRNEAHGVDISGATKEAWHRPVSIEELTSLGIQNAKYGRFYCNRKVEKVERLDQLYVQYYPVVEGQPGYSRTISYYQNGIAVENPNKEYYKKSAPRTGVDLYTLLGLNRFVKLSKVED